MSKNNRWGYGRNNLVPNPSTATQKSQNCVWRERDWDEGCEGTGEREGREGLG